ncbi:MAG: VCBS repeat-containing protein [Pyrinomonadaceae bacterium]|nr:VCBS repeat-containing protein [Pyrinomonadaceae bacterium]
MFPASDQSTDLKKVPQLIQNSKTAGAEFTSHQLFQADMSRAASDPVLSRAVTEGTVLNLNEANIQTLLSEGAPFLRLPLPDGKGGNLELELVKVNIYAPGFSVKTATGQTVEANGAAHYRGIIKGDQTSLAAISVFDNEVMGFYSTKAEGNTVLGRIGGDNPDNKHILYADKNLKASPEWGCDTEDTKEVLPTAALRDQEPQQPDSPEANCIRIYVEADYDLFLNKGSVANVQNYLTGMFNQSATIFSNDGIPVSLSEILVWDVASPYTSTTASGLLNQFKATRTNFNGDLAHLVAKRSGLGGVAWRDVMCYRSYSYAFSSIYPSYSNVPTYSWTVDVFTHETGHNIASPHTHACQWNGNGTAIDGCYTTEGGCPSPEIPADGGTIMSYCHLESVGKNFTKGFGIQPRNLMQNRFNAATCLQNCSSIPVQRPDFDFDGDGKSDISAFRPSDGVWHLLRSGSGYTGTAFGLSTDLLAPADFDGDGKADLAVFRPSNGTWYLMRSTLGFTGVQFGASGDLPVPGDFDGDDKADISVFRPSNGTWYRTNSSDGLLVSMPMGQNGDVPVMGDFDGDGKADPAVFRPSNNTWYMMRSILGFTGVQFGASGDRPVTGDFDGDRKTDYGVYRPSNGVWYVMRSQLGFMGAQFGAFEDRPVAADYDGDGKADLAVFRPSNGTWYLQRTTAGFTGQQFGLATDSAIPAAYVP